MGEENLLGSARAVVLVGTIIRTGHRDRRRMFATEAEIDTKEMGTNRIGGQAETIDSGEETGVVVEAMGIYPTSHTPKTDIGAYRIKTTMEVGWCE